MPDRVCGDRCNNGKGLFGDRMDEFDAASMKADTSIWVGTTGSVFEVTLDRTTDSGKLATNLMMPTCLKIHLQEAIVIAVRKGAIDKDSLFRIRSVGFSDIALILCFIANQVVFEPCFGQFRAALNDSPIGLSDLIVTPKHLV